MEEYNTPVTPSDVTEEWLADTLKKSILQSGKHCRRIDVKTFRAAKPFEYGLLSSIFQATCAAYKTSDDQSPTEHRVFIKTMPVGETYLEYYKSAALDVTEIECYNVLLKDMVAFERERLGDNKAQLEGMLPRAYASRYQNEDGKPRAFFLMMGDLSPRFSMQDINKGQSDVHFSVLL